MMVGQHGILEIAIPQMFRVHGAGSAGVRDEHWVLRRRLCSADAFSQSVGPVPHIDVYHLRVELDIARELARFLAAMLEYQ